MTNNEMYQHMLRIVQRDIPDKWEQVGDGFKCRNCGCLSKRASDFCPDCGKRKE